MKTSATIRKLRIQKPWEMRIESGKCYADYHSQKGSYPCHHSIMIPTITAETLPSHPHASNFVDLAKITLLSGGIYEMKIRQ